MVSVCLYFQVHQPYRLREFTIFDIGQNQEYFSSENENTNNKEILEKVASKCYIPTNKILLELLKKYPDFKITFSFSGIILEQLEKFSPEALSSFKELVKTGQVEILEETHHHSLASIYSKGEFKTQVKMHRDLIKKIFDVEPRVFRNTELIYNNKIAQDIEEFGYDGIIAEGATQTLGWRSPNFLYRPSSTSKIKLLLKNYRLSDDIAFRFSKQDWEEYPLTAQKYANWIDGINNEGKIVNLFMDYETFGEHQWEETGILKFLQELPEEILKNPENKFMTPSEIIDSHGTLATYDAETLTSWADLERDTSAWTGNEMQQDALQKIYGMAIKVLSTKNPKLIDTWRKLQTSDHFYYMSTKSFSDGQVHEYFSPYESPYEAFITYMNVLQDFETKIDLTLKQKSQPNSDNIYK